MALPQKIRKLWLIGKRRSYRSALLHHRVAAATEHLDAISFCAANTLLDVGANVGQFATAFRGIRRDADIYAFEPLPEAAVAFRGVFEGDAHVRLYPYAIGAEAKTAVFHVADRADSSSLLEPGEGQKAAFGVGEARRIEVEVRPLPALVDITQLKHPVMMKIDVQGAELEVLKGIDDLHLIDFIYVELSFVELYAGQPMFDEACRYLAEKGFVLRGIFNQAWTDEFGPTQADCLFVRNG